MHVAVNGEVESAFIKKRKRGPSVITPVWALISGSENNDMFCRRPFPDEWEAKSDTDRATAAAADVMGRR